MQIKINASLLVEILFIYVLILCYINFCQVFFFFFGSPGEESISNDRMKKKKKEFQELHFILIVTCNIYTLFLSIHSKQASDHHPDSQLATFPLEQECSFCPVSDDRPLILLEMPKTIIYFKTKPISLTISVRLLQ